MTDHEVTTCPRRMRDFGPWQRDEGLDHYETREGKTFRQCSFCGSMHPEDFMQAVRDGKEIGPTDKDYKVYVDQMDGKFYTSHLSPEQGDEFRALYAAEQIVWGYPGYLYRSLFIPTTGGDRD